MPTDARPPFESPHIGWFIAILPAMAFLTVLALSGEARAAFEAHVTTALSATFLQRLCAGAWIVHVGEALYARHLAARSGNPRAAAWMIQTFFLGFPSLRMIIGRARRAAATA